MTNNKKTYVITGATSGIGHELVKKLANKHIVYAGYRNSNCIDKLKSLGAIPFYIDMENSNAIKNAAHFVANQSIDTVINVAGCVIAGIMENLNVDNIRKQFEVNTFGHLDFSQKIIANLKNNNIKNLPKIINISSMASFGIFPFVTPYCASKRALDILFNGLALESDIKVISIKPGVIATPLWDKSIELNKSAIENCSGHEKEMKYLVGNAQRNGHSGLKVEDVADFIIKIDGIKNPKPSYTIGTDAKLAEIFAKLPFGIQNKIVKAGMKLRIG